MRLIRPDRRWYAKLHILLRDVSSLPLKPSCFLEMLIYQTRVAIYSAGAGGNYILDATDMLEFLPVTHTWLVTFSK